MMMIMMTMVMILSIQRPVYCESRTRIKMTQITSSSHCSRYLTCHYATFGEDWEKPNIKDLRRQRFKKAAYLAVDKVRD